MPSSRPFIRSAPSARIASGSPCTRATRPSHFSPSQSNSSPALPHIESMISAQMAKPFAKLSVPTFQALAMPAIALTMPVAIYPTTCADGTITLATKLLISSLLLAMMLVTSFAASSSTGMTATPISFLMPSKLMRMFSMASAVSSASFVSASVATFPVRSASLPSARNPSEPTLMASAIRMPPPPNSRVASLARSTGSSMAAMLSASRRNISSGLEFFISSTVIPSPLNCLRASFEPFDASSMRFVSV